VAPLHRAWAWGGVQARQAVASLGADHVLPGTAATALGLGAVQAGQGASAHTSVRAAGLAAVGAGLAGRHLANLGGNAGRRVADDADRPTRALDVVSLGVVDLLATIRHGHILAIGSHVNRATLRIQKLCWMVRDGFTASHVGTITKYFYNKDVVIG